MVRGIQPGVLLNGRHGRTGDFAAPEQHLTASDPWRPWEACITLNKSWGQHVGDHQWKQPAEIISMLSPCAARKGNLLLNVGPRGDGSLPQPSIDILPGTGEWITKNREVIFDTDPFTFLRSPPPGLFVREWGLPRHRVQRIWDPGGKWLLLRFRTSLHYWPERPSSYLLSRMR